MKLPTVSWSWRLVVLAGSLAVHGLGLALPLFMMQLYDRIVPNASYATLTWLAMFAGLALVLEALLRIARGTLADWHVEQAVQLGRRILLQSVMSEPGMAGRKRELFGALQTLLGDAYRQQSFYWADIPFGLLYLGVIFLIHPGLGLFMVVLGGLYVAFMLLARKPYHAIAEYRRFAVNHREDLVLAVFDQLPELKAMGAEEQVLQHHAVLLGRKLAADRDLDRHLVFRGAVSLAMGMLPVFGTVILGGVFVIAGTMTLGALTATVLLARRALSPFHGLGERLYGQVDRTQAAKALDQVPVLPAWPGAGYGEAFPLLGRSRLDLHDLALRLRPAVPGRRPAADGLPAEDDQTVLKVKSVTMEAGSLVHIPPSTDGSTSLLLEAIRGLHPWYSGEIIVGSYQTARYSSEALGRQIALLQEHEVLLPGSLMDNLSSFEPALIPQARDAAALLGLEAWFEHLERGVDTVINDTAMGGIPQDMIQRMALARVLALRPGIILLDRFDATLDGPSLEACREVILRVSPYFTILYHGSDPGLAARADMVAVQETGVLVIRSRETGGGEVADGQ